MHQALARLLKAIKTRVFPISCTALEDPLLRPSSTNLAGSFQSMPCLDLPQAECINDIVVFNTTLDPIEDPEKWLKANQDAVLAAAKDSITPSDYSDIITTLVYNTPYPVNDRSHSAIPI
jgi:hypothetical protein